MTNQSSFPEPIVSISVRPRTRLDQERLGVGLMSVATSDPSFRVETDRATGATVISGTGERHVKNIIDRLSREFHMVADVDTLRIIYKEAIRKTAEGEFVLIKRIGGRDHYAHVVVRIEPSAAFEFVDATGENLPEEYVASIRKGIVETAETGCIGGYRMSGFKATLLAAKQRSGQSSKLGFQVAGSMAFKEAARNADPCVLEPVMEVEVVVPEEHAGEVIGDLSTRLGRILGMDSIAQGTVIRAHVPLATLIAYETSLREMTDGKATFTEALHSWVEIDDPEPDDSEPGSGAIRAA